MDDKKVRLFNSAADKHEEFSPKHAERLLKYPGSVYREAQSEAKAKDEPKQAESAKTPRTQS